MPIPKPRPTEEKWEFISRCLEDPVIKNEFKDTGKKLAVCYTQWEENKTKK